MNKTQKETLSKLIISFKLVENFKPFNQQSYFILIITLSKIQIVNLLSNSALLQTSIFTSEDKKKATDTE